MPLSGGRRSGMSGPYSRISNTGKSSRQSGSKSQYIENPIDWDMSDKNAEELYDEEMQQIQNENGNDLVVVTDRINALQIVKFDEVPEDREIVKINVSSFRQISCEERSYLLEALRLFGLKLEVGNLKWRELFMLNQEKQQSFFAYFIHLVMLGAQRFSQQMFLFVVESIKDIKDNIADELRDTLGLAGKRIEGVLECMNKIQNSTQDEVYQMKLDMRCQQESGQIEHQTLIDQMRAEFNVQKDKIRERHTQSERSLAESVTQHAGKIEEKFDNKDAVREKKMFDYQQMLSEKNRKQEKLIKSCLINLGDRKKEVEAILERLKSETELLRTLQEYLKYPDKTKIAKEEAEQRKLRALISETEEKLRKFRETDRIGKKYQRRCHI